MFGNVGAGPPVVLLPVLGVVVLFVVLEADGVVAGRPPHGFGSGSVFSVPAWPLKIERINIFGKN
jgi:hypothetical protein